MKKNMLRVYIYALIVSGLAGCTKELNTVPTQTIDQATALETSNDVQVALVGAYADLGSLDFYGGRVFMAADLLGDVNEMNWSGTYQGLTQIKNKAIPVDNIFVRDIWLSGYETINDVNNVLSAMSVVTAKDSARIAGEAKFIRGASYFDLVRLFAKAWNDGTPASNDGIPLVLTPTRGITSENNVKRNSVAEIYQQVISDLLDAEAKLPATNSFFATKAGAAAMLARVYLQKGDYANAVQAAHRAITSSTAAGAVLSPNYSDAFSAANTKEDIFAMQVSSTAGTNTFNTFYAASQRGDIQITPNHLGLYEAGDTRRSLFYTNGGSTYTGKFDIRYGNAHLVRLAEMYLVRAEANFRLASMVGDIPVNDVNKIRIRAKLPAIAAVDLTLDKILKERKLELAFEGATLHDIKRLQGTVGNLPWNAPKLIFPIPRRERTANPGLTQNEGY